jgi:threonine synthase
MRYVSTRGGVPALESMEAIKMGLAPDGGLFVPDGPAFLSMDEISSLTGMTYPERAAFILSRYLTDFTPAETASCVAHAYDATRFEKGRVAPLVHLNDRLSVLELWHGPTCAFKDVALQILPRFMTQAMRKTGENREIVLLTATSGDTGKAALEGFADVPGTRVIVFYPDEGVSEVQKKQMVTQAGGNVHVVGVKGNFDDTQAGVKRMFSDNAMANALQAREMAFSSANSINWGRLVPQIVYYFSAYADLCAEGRIRCGDAINFVVPTGNFGNILAAWHASKAGLPVNRLICASNGNNVLTDFIRTGVYDSRRAFRKTVSPSMDILVSSNLERLLYELSGEDAARVSSWMADLSLKGFYDAGPAMRGKIGKMFFGGWTSEEDTLRTIGTLWHSRGYVADTHTAVGMNVYERYVSESGDLSPTVLASTASPFKFANSVAGALFGQEALCGHDDFDLLELLSDKTGWPIPAGLAGLRERPVLHEEICAVEDMAAVVSRLLGIRGLQEGHGNG